MRAIIALIVCGLLLVACGERKDEFLENAGNANDGFSNQFGMLLVQKNFAKAYMMTSPEYQKSHSVEDMQKDFEKAQSLLAPGKQLSQVQIDHGELPTSDKEATDTFQFPADIIDKKSNWKNWNIAKLSDKDGSGFSAFHLLIDQGTGPKVGFIYYRR